MTGDDVLRVGAAFPDPPFNDVDDSGLDIDLMSAIGGLLGRAVEFIRYSGRDFNSIFDALDSDGNGMLDSVEISFYENKVVPDVLHNERFGALTGGIIGAVPMILQIFVMSEARPSIRSGLFVFPRFPAAPERDLS